MNTELLYRLSQTQSDDERTWLVTESLLQTLSLDIQSLLWAAAIPHWFDIDILSALRPEITDRLESLYEQLQRLSFVELFPGRGYNIHDKTREVMLTRLWQSNQSEYVELSAKAALYFSAQVDTYKKIESIYHLAISEQDHASDVIWNYTSTLESNFQYVELDALVNLLLEHDVYHRLNIPIKAVIYYWKGKASKRIYENNEALANYKQAISLFRETGNVLGEASAQKSLGDALKFLNRMEEALESYERAIVLFRKARNCVGEANVIKLVGDTLEFLGRREEALLKYEEAIRIFRSEDDSLGEANTLTAISDLMYTLGQKDNALARSQEAISLFEGADSRLVEASAFTTFGDVLQCLDRMDEALEKYGRAKKIAQVVGDRLEEAKILKAVGDVLELLRRKDEALSNFRKAIGIFRDIGYRLGEANTLISVGNVLHSSDKENPALASYEKAAEIFHSIGYRMGEANAIAGMGNVLQCLNRADEALASYEQAIAIFHAENYYLGEADILMARGDVLRSLGRMYEAVESYSQAFDISELSEKNTPSGEESFKAAEEHLSSAQAATQKFNHNVQLLLKPNNPHARSLLSFIQRTIRQFDLPSHITEIDVFVEAYLRGVAHTQQTQEYIRQPKAWMRRVAYNIVREIKRDSLRHSTVTFDGIFDRNLLSSHTLYASSKEDDIATAIKSVLQALEVLSPNDRKLVQLKIVEGLTWKEIQVQLAADGEGHIPKATLLRRGQLALEHLRRAYKTFNSKADLLNPPDNETGM